MNGITCYKTQTIDKYFDGLGYNTDTTTDTNNSLLHHHDNENNYEKNKEELENLYGYEDAAPTVWSSSSKTPRRSSLSDASVESRQRRRATIGYKGEIELVLPTGKVARRRSSVGFKDNNENDTDSLLDNNSNGYGCDYEYDPSELWIQKDEYQHINEDVKKIIVESGSSNSFRQQVKKGLCTRGLEPVLSGSTTREEREQSIASVLDEHRIQRSRNDYNGDVLRDIYSFFAMDSQIQATERAMNDEKEVEKYLNVARNIHHRSCRRMSC